MGLQTSDPDRVTRVAAVFTPKLLLPNWNEIEWARQGQEPFDEKGSQGLWQK
jgi:hypothetical protein